MPLRANARTINPRLGTYFGIFASSFASVFLVELVLAELGFERAMLGWGSLVLPLTLFVVIGLMSATAEPLEFFAAGRRVPAVYNGMLLGTVALGATGMLALSGQFAIDGFDSWALGSGIVAGFVAGGILIAPFLRKFGCHTPASFLGRRTKSRLVRLVAAGIVAIAMLLLATAEIRVTSTMIARHTGLPLMLAALLVAGVVAVPLALGGMRALGWMSTAKALALLMALLVAAGIIGVLATNLPVPQLSAGPTLRALGRLENLVVPATPPLSAFAYQLAGPDAGLFQGRFAEPFSSLGPAAYVLLSLCTMAGVAAAPWQLMRVNTVPGVYEARKAFGWAVVVVGVVLLTIAALAGLVRAKIISDVIGRPVEAAPAWFGALVETGTVVLPEALSGPIRMEHVRLMRDDTLLVVPSVFGLPEVLAHLILVGLVAIGLAAAAASLFALAATLAEDGFFALTWSPPPDRLRRLVHGAALVTATLGCVGLAMTVQTDPLRLMQWSLAISASALFPVLVAAVWWKRFTATGALATMVVGLVGVVVAIVAGEAGVSPLASPLAATVALPLALGAGLAVTLMSPVPDASVIDKLREMRIPGGETIHDREMRLLRLKLMRGE